VHIDFPPTFDDTDALPVDLKAILDAFQLVFTIPTSLMPKRACDHAIPLISGATPVNVRAYRYPPSLKDEIEKHVQAMLDHRIILPSTSSFSSLVLLVRKKDGTWRFCKRRMVLGDFVSITRTLMPSQSNQCFQS
jgi:hypothetical protein